MWLYHGWKVTIAAAVVNFLVGINYTWSLFATGLVEQKGWTHSQAALPYSIFLFCYAFCMVSAGRAQDFYGPRPVISFGSLFAGGAFISCAIFLNYPVAAAVLWGLPLGVGLACCFASTTPAAMKWFPPEKKGLVTGLVVTSTGLAALIMSPFIQVLVQKSTAQALWICGFILAVGIISFAQLIEDPPGKIRDLRKWVTSRNRTPVLRDTKIYLLWSMFFLTTGTGVTMAAHLNNIMMVQAGYEKGYIAVSIFAFGNATGRFIGGILSDKIGRILSMTVVFSIITLMLALLVIIQDPIALMGAILILALSFGCLWSIFPTAVVSFFGESNFGLNYGLVFTGLGVAGVFPYIGGALFEMQGHYISTYILLMGSTLIAVLLSQKLNSNLLKRGE